MPFKRHLLILTGFFLATQSFGLVAKDFLPASVESAIKKSSIPKEAIAISVSKITSQQGHATFNSHDLIHWQENVAMNPASTMKLVTSLAAMEMLGPQYRWKTDLFTNVIIVGWLLALGLRCRPGMELAKPALFNLRQLVLGFWTLLSLAHLFGGIRHGLLGSPDMRIQGNGSSSHFLQWYQDIAANLLPQPGVWSLPLYCYRAVMLLWALWLAFALVRWLGWGWKCFSNGGYWKRVPKTPWLRKGATGVEAPLPPAE
jgi:hypothetical protein